MKKTTPKFMYALLALIPVLIFAIVSVFTGVSEIGVSGSNAFKIAFERPSYIWSIVAMVILSATAIYFVYKYDKDDDMIAVAVLLFVWISILYSVLHKPIDIKEDAKGAKITTEQINYLKTKGLK